MALASLPPAIELREFNPSRPVNFVTQSYWAQSSELAGTESLWKNLAFSRIAALEHGTNVAGVGDFRASENAAAQLRLYISKLPFESLPIPSVFPLSGKGILLVWESGGRAVEITAFADGEIVPEALENREANEELSQESPESLLRWLVKAPEAQPLNATTR